MSAPPSTRRRTLVLAASLAASECGVLPVLWGRGEFPFDPHVTGGCAITLDEAAATALSDALGEWWG